MFTVCLLYTSLQRQTISVETGITGTAPYGNLGRVKNEGLDMSFNYNHSFNKDFFISARGTFTLAKNEYVERDEPPYEYSYMSQVGQPLNNYYGYIAEGLFQSEDEIADSPTQELGTYKTQVGDIKYKDLNLSLIHIYAIEKLPPKCKHVFFLAKIEGLPYIKIAEMLEVSVPVSYTHLDVYKRQQ